VPPSLADFHPRGLHHLAVSDHALGVRGREPGAHQLDQKLGRKSVREHQRLGAAVRGGGEQFEGAATVGLGAVARAAGLGHGGAAVVMNWARQDTTRPGPARWACGLGPRLERDASEQKIEPTR